LIYVDRILFYGPNLSFPTEREEGELNSAPIQPRTLNMEP